MRTPMFWTYILLGTLVSAPAYPRGAISSGGGNGVVTASGTFRFLDMVADEELRTLARPDGRMGDVFSTSRCQSHPLTKTEIDLKFVSIFWQRVRYYDFRLGVALEFAIRRVAKRALSVNFDLRPMKAFSDSSRAHQEFQVPVGAYGGSYLLVNKTLYGMLPPRDQAAFLVHEGIREYASTFASEKNEISLEDLEKVTQLILDAPNSPMVSSLLKSSKILTESRFYAVFDLGGVQRSAEDALQALDFRFGEPDHEPELLPIVMASLMHLEDMRRRSEKNPEDKQLVEQLIKSQEGIKKYAEDSYRPGVAVDLRLKMLQLEMSFSFEDQTEEKWVFDTQDALWRDAKDPVCSH